MTVSRVVLLGVHHQEVQEEALPAAGRAEHQGVPDVVDVQVEAVRRSGARSRRWPAPPPADVALRGSPVSRVNRKLRSAKFVSSSVRRRRLWALLPGTMASQALRRL